MRQYPEELKKQLVVEYLSGVKKTSEILAPHNIPKSNLFRWLKKYAPDWNADEQTEFTFRNFYLRGIKIKRLEAIISILKRVNCTVDAPLKKRLSELEKLYGEYNVHVLCDASYFFDFIKTSGTPHV